MTSEHPAVVVVRGPDHELRTRALDAVLGRLLGDDDRSLALAEIRLVPARGRDGEESGTEVRESALAAALDGARTPPFGTSKRIVVVRTDEALRASEAQMVAGYLADPEPTTVLVLEAVGRQPAELAKALKAAGAETVGEVPARDATAAVLRDQAAAAGITFDRAAASLVGRVFGEDAGRVPALVDLLVSTYGTGTSLGVDDVSPYLGDEGTVPVFELTKAIDAGDVPEALAVLQRLTTGMSMHPLQVMAVLHNHFRRILRLDDAAVSNERDAVEALGGKVHAYPAKLAWQRARSLGTDGIRRAFALLARADRDLRGGSGAPDDALVAVLATELAMLSKRRAV